MDFVQLGPLTALISPQLAPEETEWTVVLLHGYGAPGTDLVGLGAELDPPAGTRFVFLQAPLLLDPSQPPAWAGRAWWHIDMLDLQLQRSSGQYDRLLREKPKGLDEAREQLDQALLALEQDHGLNRERLVIGGFSQGAMLSTDYALRSEEPLAGLAVLSGTLLTESEWIELLPARAGLPVFQSHSPDDLVLPYPLATRLAEHFRSAGLPLQFVEFAGGHGISRSVLSGLNEFLQRLAQK